MSDTYSALTALSPLDGRYRSQLSETSVVFSEFALLHQRLAVEVAYLIFLAEKQLIPTIPTELKNKLTKLVANFDLAAAEKVKNWEKQTKHDVKAVEYFLREFLTEQNSTLGSFVHIGLTSEDTNSLAYALMLKTAQTTVIVPQLKTIIAQLSTMAEQHVDVPMLAKTHGQPAVPTTVGKELINFAMRLLPELQQLEQLPIKAKLSGAVGTFSAQLLAFPTIKNWPELSNEFISSLGLVSNQFTTQIIPAESYSELFSCLIRVNGILLDLNQDIWRYISDGYFGLQLESGQVGSSTMPHKINPIDFENSEGNLGLANALLIHFIQKLPVSRLQRDLSDSTVKRSFGAAFGYAKLAYQSLSKGLKKLSVRPEVLTAELDQHWEVLAEAYQVILRMHGEEQGYEKLQKLTQGQKVTAAQLHEFISTLTVSAEVKQQLIELTPQTYLGLAAKLTHQGVQVITTYLQGEQ